MRNDNQEQAIRSSAAEYLTYVASVCYQQDSIEMRYEDENIWLTSDEILNKFAWDYGNFKISYLPQNRLNSDLTVITQTNTAFRILCSEEQQVNWYKENSNY